MAFQDALEPDIHCVRAHWNRGFMAFQPGVATAVMLYGERYGDEEARLELLAGSTPGIGESTCSGRPRLSYGPDQGNHENGLLRIR